MTLITVFAIGRHFTEPHATGTGEGSMEKEIRSELTMRRKRVAVFVSDGFPGSRQSA